ncbi:Plexin-A4 [Schistosoma japonicum]|nr:Plexin-A4 [Schistosoma japonicum]
MLYGIPKKSVLVFFIFTEFVLHVLSLAVSHNASIPTTNDSKNLRLLYRVYKPENLVYVYVASVNSIRQFSVDKLQLVAERITGPHNFSIYCLSNSDSCEKCMHVDRLSLPFGYGSDSCRPHPTNNYVKAWGTSSFPGPEMHNFNYSMWDYESRLVNDDRITFEDGLYICNTVFHGYCERITLTNVTQESPWVAGTKNSLIDKKHKNPQEIPVVGSLPYTYSVLVVGSEYIYVGTEPDGLQEHTLITLDPLTVRLKDFHLSSTQPSFESRAQLSTNPSLRIQYKSAFRYKSLPTNLDSQDQLFKPAYIYFVLQQPESSSFIRWQSRIARVCDGDKYISSYVELNILCFQCISKENEKMFNALHFSSRGTVGIRLARELSHNFQSQYDDNLYAKTDVNMDMDHSEVLIVAFASQPIDPLHYWSTRNVNPYIDLLSGQHNFDLSYETGSILLSGSAISLFSMAQINAKFDRVTINCLEGNGIHGPSHFLHSTNSDNFRCVKDDYSFNQFITGNDPEDDITAPALLYLESNVTGMAITAVSQEFTIAIFTTDDGYLYKYELLGLDKVHLLGSLQLVPNAYSTCESCLRARDPYCGWCIAEGRCLLFHQCPLAIRFAAISRAKASYDLKKKRSPNSGKENSSYHQVFWLSYNVSTDKCPVIREVSPPGIQMMSTNPVVTYVKEDSQYYQQNIILILDPILSHNLPNSDNSDGYFGRNQLHPINSFSDLGNSHFPSIDGSSVTAGSQLFCSFREAPRPVLQMESLISGTLSNFDLNKILLSVTRTPLITRTAAKLLYSSGKPVEAHCLSPAVTSLLPLLVDDKASIPLLLWLEKVKATDVDSDNVGALAPALFAIYNCSQLKDCQSCARSRFVCAWCLFEDQCVPIFSTLSTNGRITTTVCRDSPYLYSKFYEQTNSLIGIIPAGHADDCPRFTGSPGRITLTSGSSLSINFQVSNVQKQQIVGFSCSENCTNQHVRASFNQVNSTINLTEQLNARQLSNSVIHSSHDSAVNCGLDLYWHGSNDHDAKGHRMVNEDQVHAEVFACEWLAEYCDNCLDLPARFGCSWCVSTQENMHIYNENRNMLKGGKCRTKNSCIGHNYLNGSTTVHQYSFQPGDVCPNPEILSLTPTNGTLTGQPVLTITGRNLGRSISDIVDVFLDLQPKIKCIVLSETYQRSHKFMCKLVPAPFLSLPASGKLKVVISNKRYEAYSPNFHFAMPHLIYATPQRGPKAGGTRLYLTGTNLNIGSQRIVYLYLPTPRSETSSESHLDRFSGSNVKVKCEIEQESETLIVCLTGPLLNSTVLNTVGKKQIFKQHSVSVSVLTSNSNDNNNALTTEDEHIPLSLVMMHDMTSTYLSHSFSFIYTPNPSVHEVQRQNVLATGGTTVRVFGTFLFVVQDPKLVFYFNGSEYSMFQDTHLVEDMSDKSLHINEKLDNLMQSNTSFWTNRNKQPITSRLSLSQPLIQSQLESNPEFFHSAFSSHISSWPISIPYGFIMDGVHQLRVFGFIKVYQDPVVLPFPDNIRVENLDDYSTNDLIHDQHIETVNYNYKYHRFNQSLERPLQSTSSINYSSIRQLIRIHGHFDTLLSAPELAKSDELTVRIGDSLICEVNSIMLTEIRCDLDRKMILKHHDYLVEVQFGRFLVYRPGSIRFIALRQAALRNQVIMLFIGLLLILIFVSLIGFVIWRRFMKRQRNYQARLDEKYTEHENRFVRIFKEDFMELQTTMQEFSQEVKKHNLPYRDYRTFCLFSLFPEYHCELMHPIDPHTTFPLISKTDVTAHPLEVGGGDVNSILPPHPLLSPSTVRIQVYDDAAKGISLFHTLLCNRQFLCLLIHLIDEDKQITAKDKSPTAFRRAETIVDKILSNWLTFLLYKFIKNNVGENLFYFYRALVQQINMGPRDAITGKARYTLDSSSLLQTEMTGKQIVLCVEDPQHLFDLSTPYVSVKVLNCDTITQAKEKILDAIYKNKPYSKQIKSTQLQLKRLDESVPTQNPAYCSLLSLHEAGNEVFTAAQTLFDWDVKIRSTSDPTDPEKFPIRLNCIADYNLEDNVHVALVACEVNKSNHIQSMSDVLQSNRIQPQSMAAQNSPEVIHTPYISRPLPEISPANVIRSMKNNSNQPVTVTGPTHNVHVSDVQSRLSTPSEVSFCFRPTGVPDPKLWYHLERPVNHNTIADASGENKKSSKLLDNRSNNHMKRLFCTCMHKVDYTHVNDCIVNKGNILALDLCEDELTKMCSDRLMETLPKEVFFNRLLLTRLSVTKYMDKLFEVIFSSVVQSHSLPAPIKFLFDFLDDRAVKLGIQDAKIFITNLDYIFDIPLLRNTALERSFRTFSHAMTYACAPNKEKITKDSSLVKLLFAPDISQQWNRVHTYYREIKALPSVEQQAMDDLLRQHSYNHFTDFNVTWAVYELYTKYVRNHQDINIHMLHS